MESTGSQVASHPAVVRTQKAAAALQSQHMNPLIMKVSPTHRYISILKTCNILLVVNVIIIVVVLK